MRPFVIYGSSDKARYSFGLKVAQENNYIFEAFEAKEVESYSKHFLTSTFASNKILFFMLEPEKLSYPQVLRFLELIKDSPHIFLLSTANLSKVEYALQKMCLKKSLGTTQNAVTSALQALMTTENRNEVRKTISEVDPLFLFHILKRDCWKAPETLPAMLRISQYIYKSKKSYITSLLAFALPQKTFALSYKKAEGDKMMKSILGEIAKVYNVNSSEAADIYLLIKKAVSLPEELQLSDEQTKFLGVTPSFGEDKQASIAESPVILANLEDFF